MGIYHKFFSSVPDLGDSSLVRPSNWNDDHALDAQGLTFPSTVINPSTPSAGNIQLFADNIANFELPAYLQSSGFSAPLQPSIFKNTVCYTQAQGGVGAWNNVGLSAVLTVGTVAARTFGTTFVGRQDRTGLISSASAGSFAVIRATPQRLTMGTGTLGVGGFYVFLKVNNADALTGLGCRGFYGVTSVVSPTNVEPSTLTNTIGFATLSTSDNLHLVYGGSAAQVPIDLGVDFPANTNATTYYEMVLHAPSNDPLKCHWLIRNVATNVTATGTITATTSGVELPLPTQSMAWNLWRCNNTTATVCSFDLHLAYTSRENP